MTRNQARGMHVANVLVGGSGLVYGWMRYLAVPGDEFALVNHPWQPAMQHAHVLLAPLVVFCVGLVWHGHVWRRLRRGLRSHRRSGLGLALLFGPMVASGYLLQTASSLDLRALWVWVHDLTSLAWLAGALTHPFLPRATGSAELHAARVTWVAAAAEPGLEDPAQPVQVAAPAVGGGDRAPELLA